MVKTGFGLNSKEFIEYIKLNFKAEIHEDNVLPIAVYESNGKKIAGTFPKTYVTPYDLSGEVIDYSKLMVTVMDRYSVDEVRFKILGLRPEDKYSPWLVEDVISTSILEIKDQSFETYFKSETRTAIRKSLKAGFRTEFTTKLDAFYKLYLDNMQRFRTKPKDLAHFEKMQTIGDKYKIMLCYKDTELAGANIFYINGNYLLMHHNLSYSKFWPMRVNNYLFYQMIDYGHKQGVKLFDFGPGLKSDVTHNRFKENYGAKEFKIYTGVLYKNYLFSTRDVLINKLKLWRQTVT